MRIPTLNITRKTGSVLAIAALVAIGGLVALAAPHMPTKQSVTSTAGGIPTTTAPNVRVTQSPQKQHLALVSTPTDPAATAPINPTATPIPPATPTSTPSPSWHTIASYAGNTPQSFAGFTTGDPWQLVWTCTPGASETQSFAFEVTADGADIGGFGDQCTDQNPTSGTWGPCQPGQQSESPCDTSHTYVASSFQSGPDPMCQWTLAIQEWY